ncbi:endonuclease/exonuclease/phosphatase family protein (macronuclear) [Tetrahymena thermophila SB210]|uniref:Endonuclease/exonuclease/phosphatase family protein n=1 Tax=Tetrahymena thermophila (strain SB210) TaxID=312017 RepID=Q23JA6_TETTS|nr:endonuclease/exonuclease/phosphatase family protein [Tetrahymena thermophila SB210]EAR96598.2 endonuclease/exonuclease/phosphatase family protein [Tetrahymena thermophila SB210]|eukprot:XP_001016843.2 endonuclease/exonuclease/phosphatase family protein [Tetrahymena thermophila SB210]
MILHLVLLKILWVFMQYAQQIQGQTSLAIQSNSLSTTSSSSNILTNDTVFYNSTQFLSTCPKLKNTYLNGRQNVVASQLFQLDDQTVFDVSQETNPYQITITIWKSSGKVIQQLTEVNNCINFQYDNQRKVLLLLCSSTDVYLYQYSSGTFVLFQIFQNLNTLLVTDVQLQPQTSQTQFATLCFQESELRFWSVGSVLPIKTLYLHIPNANLILPSAFNFIFIPYTKYVAVFDINRSIIRLIDTDTGDIFKTSNRYLKYVVAHPFKNFIQYNYLWKLIVVLTQEKLTKTPAQRITTFFANDTTQYNSFKIDFQNDFQNRVTCMHVLQGSEMVALGNKDGSMFIYNLITGKKVRTIQVSSNEVLDILLEDNVLYVLAKDQNDETLLQQYDWFNNYYVETRITNQPVCVNQCNSIQYQSSAWLACRQCNAAFKCASCNDQGCVTCISGLYIDQIVLSNGKTQNVCTSICSSNQFGLGFDNSSNTQCVEICPSNVYDFDNKVCSLSTSIENSSQEYGITASLKISPTNDQIIMIDFSKAIQFNKQHILSATNQVVSNMQQCVLVDLQKIKPTDYSYSVTLDATDNTYIQLQLKYLGSGGVKNPILTVTFEGQTCFKDLNYVPLGPSMINPGIQLTLPWNLVNYDPGTKQTSQTISQTTKGVSTAVASATIPLALMNIMYIFWLLINVFQLVSFLLYLNVLYPINVTDFFRSFKSFNMNFLPTFGLKFDSATQKYTFLGETISDQTPAAPFVREGMTSSFFLNGLKFIQTFFILYAVLFIVRIVARHMKVNCRKVPEDAGFFHKLTALAQQKLEFTMIITSHQSTLLSFSVSIFLQFMGFSSQNAMNVISFIVAIFAFIYLIFFLKNCYQKVNLHEMVVGSKISDKLVDEKLKDKYEKYKMQYGILYWSVNFIFYGRRNYHVFMMFRQVLVPFVVVFFNKFTFVSIFILIGIYGLTTIFLILYRPFDRKLVGYLNAFNDMVMTLILCLIFYIHSINESSGQTLSKSDVEKQVNVGWVIISLLLLLFLINVISGIVLEWESIVEAFNNLKQKLREYTKSHSVELKDNEEKIGLNKSQSFQQDEEKINSIFKDSLKKKNKNVNLNQEKVKQAQEISLQDAELSEVNISQTSKPLNKQSPSPKKGNKRFAKNPDLQDSQNKQLKIQEFDL